MKRGACREVKEGVCREMKGVQGGRGPGRKAQVSEGR